MSPVRHEVLQGESVATIAARYGLFPDTVWNDDANADLKALRLDPNVLLPGDVLIIPPLRGKQLRCSTGSRHVFRRNGVPLRIDVLLLDSAGTPRAGQVYTLVVGEKTYSGSAADDGRILQWVDTTARRAELRIGQSEIYWLDLHVLDPVDTDSGVRGRLANLSYLKADADPSAEELASALRRFQTAEGLAVTGVCDDATRARLVRLHRS